MLAKAMPSPWINVQVLITLGVILAGSVVMFWTLVRRWESHRQWLALDEWGRENGFRLSVVDPARLPAPFDSGNVRNPVVRLSMEGQTTRLIQMQTDLPQQGDVSRNPLHKQVWNLLVRQLETSWYPTGLRPSGNQPSVMDLFSLSSFPAMGTTERFMVFGTDSAAARSLSGSMIRSLLPPDIGLLLHGNQLVLDFSERPFDEIEFNRMLSLAEQIVEKLP